MSVHVIIKSEIDATATRSRLRASSARGETRVFVDWPFRWRMISNLEQWGIKGVAVDTW